MGVCLRTFRRWESEGKIKTIKTPSGQRRYDIDSFIKKESSYHFTKNLIQMISF
ncbi:MAG: hypothetical protein PUP93_09585 [Rhizonema sp. NSF051]|nr:hypothetical protein [Rhizonema sp. NSF051]